MPIPVLFYKMSELDRGTYDYLRSEYPNLDIDLGQEIKIVACAGYLNYLISNEIIILPSYWTSNVPLIQKENDSIAKFLFQKYYPEREIIQINPLRLNYAGGGMHCTYYAVPQN